jgi:hypothetical protein
MPGAMISTLSAILKEYYLPPVVEQLNNEVLLLQRLESRDQEIVGTAAFVPVHTGRSGGIGARGEYVQLPEPGNQAYTRAQFDLKYLYGVVRVSGPSMAKTASEAGAFLQALRSELDGIRNDLKKDVARQVYGNGDGVVGQVAANTAVNTLAGHTNGSLREAIEKGQLYVGMVVDIGPAATPSSAASNRTITGVSAATNGTITVDGAAVTTANGDGVGRQGARTANATYEITGLQNLISTAANTVGGINSATNAFWDNIRDTAGTAISHDRLMQMFNRVRIAGGEVSAIYSSFGVQRDFYNTFQTNIRYMEPLKLNGGFQTLEFMGKPIIADVDAPYNRVFLVDERFLKVFSNRDWHFLDEDNSTLKWDTNYDAWKAVLARYMNLGVTRRNTMAVITTNNTTGY